MKCSKAVLASSKQMFSTYLYFCESNFSSNNVVPCESHEGVQLDQDEYLWLGTDEAFLFL